MLLMAPLRLPVLQTQELVGKRSILAVPPTSTPVLALEQGPSSPGISIPPLARERSCSTSLALVIRPTATPQLALRRWRVTLMALQTPPLVLLRSYTAFLPPEILPLVISRS